MSQCVRRDTVLVCHRQLAHGVPDPLRLVHDVGVKIHPVTGFHARRAFGKASPTAQSLDLVAMTREGTVGSDTVLVAREVRQVEVPHVDAYLRLIADERR